MMYDELVALLRKKYDKAPMVMEAADAIEDLSRLAEVNAKRAMKWAADAEKAEKAPCWIPVTERLPEEEEVVLVWGGASVYTAKRHNEFGGMMWWKLNSKRHYCNPTHWMPLPEPPKGEA